MYFTDYTTSLYDPGNRLKRRNIRHMLPRITNKKILDVGGGSGDIRYDFINRGADDNQYVSLDISRNTLLLSKQLSDNISHLFIGVQGDGQNLPFADGSFDIIICSEVIEHLQKDDLALKEMSRVLKKDGRVLITTPYLGNPSKKWGHLRHYDLEMFTELVESSGFAIEQIIYQGRFHNITWVYLKRILSPIYTILRILTRKRIAPYYESIFHRKIIMPAIDQLLRIDDLFNKKPHSFIGDKASIIALLKKAGDI